jgi:hypothetical protein
MMGFSIRRNVYVNRYLYAVALDRVKKAFGKKYYENPNGTERNPEDALDEILSIFIVLFDEKYGGESNELN